MQVLWLTVPAQHDTTKQFWNVLLSKNSGLHVSCSMWRCDVHSINVSPPLSMSTICKDLQEKWSQSLTYWDEWLSISVLLFFYFLFYFTWDIFFSVFSVSLRKKWGEEKNGDVLIWTINSSFVHRNSLAGCHRKWQGDYTDEIMGQNVTNRLIIFSMSIGMVFALACVASCRKE